MYIHDKQVHLSSFACKHIDQDWLPPRSPLSSFNLQFSVLKPGYVLRPLFTLKTITQSSQAVALSIIEVGTCLPEITHSCLVMLCRDSNMLRAERAAAALNEDIRVYVPYWDLHFIRWPLLRVRVSPLAPRHVTAVVKERVFLETWQHIVTSCNDVTGLAIAL